jgi:hypothetical protein
MTEQVKESFGRSRYRWEGDIKTYLTKIGWEPVNWINLAKARDSGVAAVKPGINLDSLKCEEYLEHSQGTGVFSRRTVHQRVDVFFSFNNMWSNKKKLIELADNQELLRNIHFSFQKLCKM